MKSSIDTPATKQIGMTRLRSERISANIWSEILCYTDELPVIQILYKYNKVWITISHTFKPINRF